MPTKKPPVPEPVTGPQIAAAQCFTWLMEYARSVDTPGDRLPRFCMPRGYASDDGPGEATCGVIWEAGPDSWAVLALMGDPIAPGAPHFDCNRPGCRVETVNGDDLFWYETG